MRLSLALAALAAVVPTFASVIPSHPGIIIPLSKRAVPMKESQGVANSHTLRSLSTRTSRKLRRAFLAYERNMGKAHPFAMRASGDARERDDGSGAEPLISDSDLTWHGTISVGTPPVNFTVDFDTGSSDFYLPGITCGATCRGHKIYDTAASSTARDLDKPFEIDYDDGSSVQGELFADTVTIGGLTVGNQTVGVASQYPTDFTIDDFLSDGVMGMALPGLSTFGSPAFFENLVTEGRVIVPQFSFKLAANDSELFLGGSNPKLFTGEFTTVNVTELGFWQVSLDSVNAGGKQAITGVQATINTAVDIIFGPELDVVKFYQDISGSKDATDTIGEGYFTFPCDTDPQVSLTFGGKQFDIPVSSFNLGPVTQGSTDCVGGVVAQQGLGFWIVGGVFLKNFYTRFDTGAKQVGFATLA